jgi:hypothetical protein
VAAWSYTNTAGGTIRVSLPNSYAGHDAVLGPGVTLTFQALGGDFMTIYDEASFPQAGPGGSVEADAAGREAAVTRRGKVRDLALPGDGGG